MKPERTREETTALNKLFDASGECLHLRVSDRGFLYPEYTCMICGKRFGETYPHDKPTK